MTFAISNFYYINFKTLIKYKGLVTPLPVLILNVFRWKPLSSIYSDMDNDFDHWSLVLSLGNMDSNEVVMDNAIIYSVYDSGPWLGYRFDSNPSVGWISGGKEHFDLMVISSHFLNF